MALEQFLRAFQFSKVAMSESEWTAEYNRFRSALRVFWLQRGVSVDW